MVFLLAFGILSALTKPLNAENCLSGTPNEELTSITKGYILVSGISPNNFKAQVLISKKGKFLYLRDGEDSYVSCVTACELYFSYRTDSRLLPSKRQFDDDQTAQVLTTYARQCEQTVR